MDWQNLPHSGQIGAAGVQHVAAQMLLRRITPCFPIWDDGYDLISAYRGVLKRLQVKATTTIEKRRQHLNTLRFSLHRRRGQSAKEGKQDARVRKLYTPDLFDVMVFVNFTREKVFVVPASRINFNRAHIYLADDSPWLDAWWVLQQNNNVAESPKRKRK